MKFTKVWTAMVGVLACVACAVATTAGASAKAHSTARAGVKGKTVLIIAVNPTNSYVLQAVATAKRQAAKNGLKATEDGVTAGNPQDEVNAIENAASANRYDSYIIIPQNATEDRPAIKQLVATGKPVIGDSIALGPNLCQLKPQVQGVAGSALTPICDVVNQGFVPLTKQVCAGLHPCNIGWLVGLVGFPGEEAMLAGVKREAAKIGAHVYESAPTNYVIANATTETENLLTAHPNINVMWASAPQMYLGMVQALPKKNKSKIRIATDGGVQQQLTALKTGKPDVVGIVMGNGLPQTDTVNAVKLLVKALQSKKYRNVGVNSINAAGLPMVFTKANRAQWKSFKAQWSAAG